MATLLAAALAPEAAKDAVLRAGEPLFAESAAPAGLAFTRVNGASGKYYLPEMMGSGVALFDYDNDGWLDLFVANGAVNVIEAQGGQPSPFRMKNQLFHNTGAGRFVERAPRVARRSPAPRSAAARRSATSITMATPTSSSQPTPVR